MKKIFIVFTIVSLIVLFPIFGSAVTIQAYDNINYNNSQAVQLYSYYMNFDFYNPFSTYSIIRSGQYEYTLLVYPSSDSDQSVHIFTLNTQYNNNSIVYTKVNVSDLNIVSTGYNMISSDSGYQSLSINQFQVYYILKYILIILFVLITFSIFRSKFNVYKRGFDV